MAKLGFLLAVFLTLAIPLPASARTLSAQDVLTVCLTTPKDPLDVLIYFRANGWSDIPETDRPKQRDKVALTFLARGLHVSAATLKEKEYWAKLQDYASKLMESTTERPSVVLYHSESGAILILSPDKKPRMGLDCLLSIPTEATKKQEFHPKLSAPPAPEVFETKLDGFDLSLSRTKILTTSVSVSQPAVDETLGIKTDIAAVFWTSIQYPAWAVTP